MLIDQKQGANLGADGAGSAQGTGLNVDAEQTDDLVTLGDGLGQEVIICPRPQNPDMGVTTWRARRADAGPAPPASKTCGSRWRGSNRNWLEGTQG